MIFLDDHPGWTYGDLMGTPDRIVAGIRLLDRKKAEHGRR